MHLHALGSIESSHRGVVGGDAAHGLIRRIGFPMEHHRLGGAGLDGRRRAGIRVAHAHAEHRNHLGREAKDPGDILRTVSHGTDVDRPQPQGFRGHRGILGRQGGIDRCDEEHLQEIECGTRTTDLDRNLFEPRKIRKPDQLQRGLTDMGLPPCQFREGRPAIRVLNRHHAPGVEVG